MEQITASVKAMRFRCGVCGELYKDEAACEECERYHLRFHFDSLLYNEGDVVRLISDDNSYKINRVYVYPEKKTVMLRVSALRWGILEWDRKTRLVCSTVVTGHCPGAEYQRMEKAAAKDLREKLYDLGVVPLFQLQWSQSKLKVNVTVTIE